MPNKSYTDKLLEHFMNPRNVGVMKDADGEGTCGDPGCGDALTLYIKVNNDVIEDISFMVFGCPAAIATSSMTTELIKGKTIKDALKLTDEDIMEALGGLPEDKMHCSNLGAEALRNAISDYFAKNADKKLERGFCK